MSAVKPALQEDASAVSLPDANPVPATGLATPGPRRLPDTPSVRPFQPRKDTSFQPRVPVIIGEASYRGLMPVDGIISGQFGASGNTLTVKQRPKAAPPNDTPELNGELSFKDMLRVNGHIAGKVFSYRGTLIIDASARVEAEIDVAVCVIGGIVEGDVTAHERVEVGSGAVVKGNIRTPALSIKPGAVFQGDCRMLKEEAGDK